jgi:hypothetical protein
MLPQSPYTTTLGVQPGTLVLVAAKALKMQIISSEWTTLTSRLL